ncbi:MAG: carbamate kinase, partial [Firmicutes bacterium]|nr:carbamate kinase [Bacillota bacterium]
GPPKTLYLCGAMTQGQIGWMVQNRLQHHLAREGIDKPVCTVVTQVVVDDADPDFQDPSKPVGPFYTKEEAMELVRDWGYIVKEVRPGKERGWRRVVPSPEPIDIVEKEAIARLVKQGVIVVASGGGGIPVKRNEDGSYSGVDAVIDKDLAGFKLAQVVEADKFVILTDVEKAYLNYGKPDQRPLDVLKADEAERYLNEGHFLMGSMGPKVKACVRFVRWSGKEALITSLDRAIDALQGR